MADTQPFHNGIKLVSPTFTFIWFYFWWAAHPPELIVCPWNRARTWTGERGYTHTEEDTVSFPLHISCSDSSSLLFLLRLMSAKGGGRESVHGRRGSPRMSIWPKWGWREFSPLLLWFQYKRSNIGERYVFTLRCPWLRRKKATRCSHCNFRQHNKSDLWLGGGQERNLRYSHHFCKHSYKYNSDSPLHVRKNVKIYMYLRCGQNCGQHHFSCPAHLKPASRANPSSWAICECFRLTGNWLRSLGNSHTVCYRYNWLLNAYKVSL